MSAAAMKDLGSIPAEDNPKQQGGTTMTHTPASGAVTGGATSPIPMITTVAGTGVAGFGGDGGPATDAQLNNPVGLGVDSAGILYIADYRNHRVRKVTLDGMITTVAGTGVAGFGGDGGPATSAQLDLPAGVDVDSAGNLYIAENNNHRVRKVTPDGVITTVAGTGVTGFGGDGGPATDAQLNNPAEVMVDSAGTLYIADFNNHRVRKVTPDGVITTVAGTGVAGFGGDGGPATDAQLNGPAGVVMDSAEALYVSDLFNHRVRKVTPDGVITTVAGTGVAGFSGDGGPATAAQLNTLVRIALDSADALYIADRSNHRVRKIGQDGVITTVAGTGIAGFSGDGGPATDAQLDTPLGVAVDSAGTLYIADHNERVRQVTGVGADS
jgi:hypothetical protein